MSRGVCFCDTSVKVISDIHGGVKCGIILRTVVFCEQPMWDVHSMLLWFSATVEELNCPVGTYNNETGLGSVDQCRPCNPGYYCIEGSITPTGPCDKGFYCPSPFANPFSPSPAMVGSYGARQVRPYVSVVRVNNMSFSSLFGPL